MMALARKIVSDEEDESKTVEEVFAQTRDAEASTEELLVDDGWKLVAVEPEAIAVNGNGHYANGNGNDHHDEAVEPQETLLSWAESMTEAPVSPQGRARKPQPASESLFAWPLNLERERKTELRWCRALTVP